MTYTYDDNGNLLRKGTVDGAELYEYNGFNQLVVFKQGDGGAAYGYNASGIRVSKQVGETYTYYLLDGGDVVAECEDGLFSAIYTRGVNLIYRLTMDGVDYYLHDAHGDVVALTDDFGAVTKRYAYDAFGNEENPEDSDTNPFRYCGEYFDKETGTYYLRARYYDPAIGRFTQQDTHWSPANMIYGDNPRKIYERQDALGLSTCTYAPEISAIMQSGNLYVYCTNSPVMYSDPSGQTATEEALSSLYNWLITAWWIPFVDGPIPVAEIALAVVTTILVVDVGASYLADAAQTRAWVVNKIETGGENKNNLKNHSVYVIYETGTTDVWYVGRTSNYEARQKAHQRSGGRFPSAQFTMIPVKTGLSLEDARALEETLICAFLADLCFQNAIHSIARKKWSKFEKNFQRASSLIGALLDD